MPHRFLNLGESKVYFAEPDPDCLLRIEAAESLESFNLPQHVCNETNARKPGETTATQTDFLPCELLLKVFKHLPIWDRFAVAKVCKSWAAVVGDGEIWQEPLVHSVMPEPGKSPRDQFDKILRCASGIGAVKVKFSKEPPSDVTPVAVFTFPSLRHVVATVGLNAEVSLMEALGKYCPDLTLLAFQFMQFHDLLVFGYLGNFKK
jgi:hypothetical protein